MLFPLKKSFGFDTRLKETIGDMGPLNLIPNQNEVTH